MTKSLKENFAFVKGKLLDVKTKVHSKPVLNWSVFVLAILLMPFIYQILTEFIRIQSLTAWAEYIFLRLPKLFWGWIVLVMLFAAIAFCTRRLWFANLVMGIVLFFGGSINLYDLIYRGSPLTPKDLTQWKEAADIATGLSIKITREMWVFLLVVLASTVFLAFFSLPAKKGWKSTLARILVPVFFISCTAGVSTGIFGNQKNSHVLGLNTEAANLSIIYYNNTFVTSFIYYIANIKPVKPDNYSESAMLQISQEAQAVGGKKADVVTILLESFFDISDLPGMVYSEELMPNVERLAKEGIYGTAISQSWGGGTANAEFSVLTGFSLWQFPEKSMPYVEYIDETVLSLPRYYYENGYNTVAVHPFSKDYYNRPKVYENFRFQEFYTVDDFAEIDYEGAYIGDDAFADKLIEEYEKNLKTGQPIFLQGVTMQNHTPYRPNRYDEAHTVKAVSGKGDYYDASLSTFATGIRDTDAMIGKLADYFAKAERDVVLLVYGDHQSPVINEDEIDLVGEMRSEMSLTETESWRRSMEVPYLMWSNFKQIGKPGGVYEHAMLMPVMMKEYGLQTPGWYAWLGEQAEYIGGHIGGYYFTPNGEIATEATTKQQEILDKWMLFQYDTMFGEQYAKEYMY